jgi:hypothetical protein
MSKVLKEIKVITGTYKNKNGEQKNRYSRIGSIIDTSKGPMLKIDSIPLKEGGWDGWAYLNDPMPQDDGGVPNPHPQARRAGANFDNMEDDIPF